jgi:hypothetical protein
MTLKTKYSSNCGSIDLPLSPFPTETVAFGVYLRDTRQPVLPRHRVQMIVRLLRVVGLTALLNHGGIREQTLLGARLATAEEEEEDEKEEEEEEEEEEEDAKWFRDAVHKIRQGKLWND